MKIQKIVLFSWFFPLILPSKLEAQNQKRLLTDTERYNVMASMQEAYGRMHDRPETWFLQEIPEGRFLPMALDIVWKRGEEIRANLEKWSKTSKDTEAVWRGFGHFASLLYIGEKDGMPIMRSSPNPGSIGLRGLEEKKALVFISRKSGADLAKMIGTGMLLSWRKDAGITLAAIEWPENLLAGLLYFQMHIGVRYPVGARLPGLWEREYSDTHMQAYWVASQILNAVTVGEYWRRFDRIIKKSGPSAIDCVPAISLEDMKFFDKILGMEQAGSLCASFAVTQHYFNLATYSLNKQGKPKEEWGEFFVWLSKSSKTVRRTF